MYRRFLLMAVAASASIGAPALAQDTTNLRLNQYEQPVAGDAFFAVPAPWVAGHLIPRALLTFDYAKDPLILVDPNGEVLSNAVTQQATLHLGFSFALWSRISAGADFPMVVEQDGEDTRASLAPQSSAAPGDLRFSLRGRLFGELDAPFQLGIGTYLYVPTAPEAEPGDPSYSGEGSVYVQPHLLLGGRVPFFVWSASAGAVVRASENPHTFNYSAGAGVVLFDDMLQIGPELFGAVAFEDSPVGGSLNRNTSTNAELLGGAKFRFLEAFVLGAAGGGGLTDGVGTPSYRVLVSLSVDPKPAKAKPPRPRPRDRDGDEIFDRDDACPDVPGEPNDDPEKHGCPPPEPVKPLPSDRDGDNILDKVDACPDTPGVPSDDPLTHGCPPSDRDKDSIIDKEDACPDVPGDKHPDPKKNGCPGDRDEDTIIDKVDACPDTPGVADPDPLRHGCPKVVVTDTEIKILEKIEFEFDKATILPVSDPILDAVAKTMIDNSDIELIEVQGHTDNKGGPFYNQGLSAQRANAVRNALIKRGVAAKRLRAKGYGQSQPLASNDTEEGRATNRRVQFQIITRATK